MRRCASSQAAIIMRLGPATFCALLALLATAVAGADPVAVAATVAADSPLVRVEFYGVWAKVLQGSICSAMHAQTR